MYGPHQLADGEAPEASDGMWLDVNGDGYITPADALAVLNRINAWGPHPALPKSVRDPQRLDVNRDGTIDRADAEVVLDYLSGKREMCTTCDVNDDGRVSTLDALLILNHLSARERATADLSASAGALGVVYTDANQNGCCDAGEGVADTPVYFNGADRGFSVLTMSTGGFLLNVLPGTYEVTAYPPGLCERIVVQQTFVAGLNIIPDFVIGTCLPLMLDGPSPWQNPVDRLDVNGDYIVSASDAIVILNAVNANGPHELPADRGPVTGDDMWLDVNGDGYVTLADEAHVIHQLTTGGPYYVPRADDIHDSALTELLEAEDGLLLATQFDVPLGESGLVG